MLPTPAAPRLARSIAARSSSGDVQHFNPLVNPPSGSSRIVEKPLQPLPPCRGARCGLGQMWCSLCSLRGRGCCAASCQERRMPSLPPSHSHRCARIARERPPGWILACLLGRLLQREQDHRSLDRIFADACQSMVSRAHDRTMHCCTHPGRG